MELTSTQVSQLIDISRTTVNKYIDDGILLGYRQGPRRIIRVQLDDLRNFAEEYNFQINEELLCEMHSQK